MECALIACIAKATARHEFPEKKRVEASYSHNLGELVGTAGLEDARADRANREPAFRKNWETVKAWSEQSR